MDIKKIRAIRKMRKVKLKELSTRTGISTVTLSRIERGLTSPTVFSVMKIARVLEFRIEIIL